MLAHPSIFFGGIGARIATWVLILIADELMPLNAGGSIGRQLCDLALVSGVLSLGPGSVIAY